MGSVAGVIAVSGLVAVAIVHGVWAREIWWPLGDPDRFRATVMGPTSRLPRPIESWTVAALLVAAAGFVAAASFGEGPRLVGLAAWIAAGVLALRGVGGFVLSTFIQTTGPFATWDRRLYSPLCLTLAACMAAAIA